MDDSLSSAVQFYARATGNPTPVPPDDVDGLVQLLESAVTVRQLNSAHGGAVLAALYAKVDSWREVERLTGIPVRTARRWAEPFPTSTDTDTE